MEIKRLTATDLSRYRELMLHAYATEPDSFLSTTEEREAQPDSWWLQRLAEGDGNNQALGAFQQGQLVGSVALSFFERRKERHKARLIGLFVDKPFRGIGLGASLLKAALDAARARAGIRVLILTVAEDNGPAVHLYESLGFRAFGLEPMALATENGFKAILHMWLPL
jgi:RimJ/RimL family protein N-acetyltransferase